MSVAVINVRDDAVELQISPLRCGLVEMTKGTGATYRYLPPKDKGIGAGPPFGLLPSHEAWVPHISLVVREMWEYHGALPEASR